MRDRMQPLDAILAAGRPVVLVGRPHGVTHLYEGPLTQTGLVPSKRRPVCGARTRRLYDRSSFPVRGALLVCARCSTRTVPPTARVEHHSPVPSLADDRRCYRSLTPLDLYLSIRFATTEDELAECSVALQLAFTPEEQAGTYTSPSGRTFSNLAELIDQQRARIRQGASKGLAPKRPKNEPAYWDAVHRIPHHRRQTIRLRTA